MCDGETKLVNAVHSVSVYEHALVTFLRISRNVTYYVFSKWCAK